MKEKRNSISAGIAFGILVSIALVANFGIQYAITAGTISGFMFGSSIYFFLKSKTIKKQMQLKNVDEKSIIHSGSANHFKKGEAVGGKLYLLKDKIQFKSHKMNFQNHELNIKLSDVKEVSFYNTLGLIPNGLAIKKNNDDLEKFVVNGRKTWKKEIENLK